jgi:metal-responsive CopG/Arc/MetJ family transcriptional regulator
MLNQDVPKTLRLNVMISEHLSKCLDQTADSLGMSRSAFVRQAVEDACERSREHALAEAAEALALLYESDKELTAFTVLDGEDFHE